MQTVNEQPVSPVHHKSKFYIFPTSVSKAEQNAGHGQVISIDKNRLEKNREETASGSVTAYDPPFGSNGNLGWAERGELAASPMISIDMANCLKNDPHYFVRVRLASNANCAEAVLAELVNDNNRLVRAAVAANPMTSYLVVSQLSKDPVSLVRDCARSNVSLLLGFPSPKPAEKQAALCA